MPPGGHYRGLTGFFPRVPAARTFRKLESSPVRKLITTPPRKPPLPEG